MLNTNAPRFTELDTLRGIDALSGILSLHNKIQRIFWTYFF